MKKFIAIAKYYREKYQSTVPFIWTMCKDIVREDVGNLIVKNQSNPSSKQVTK